jgi:hypothetical protein
MEGEKDSALSGEDDLPGDESLGSLFETAFDTLPRASSNAIDNGGES